MDRVDTLPKQVCNCSLFYWLFSCLALVQKDCKLVRLLAVTVAELDCRSHERGREES